jgi:aminopeptidase N
VGLGGLSDPDMLGNPGYDVSHYDLGLVFEPDTRFLDANVTLTATATTDLDTINVDFVGFDISAVTIDGRTVTTDPRR